MIHHLTHREWEVSELIAFGMTEKEIARHLEISTNTIKIYKRNVYNKTGCRNIADVARWYIQEVHGIKIEPSACIKRLISVFMLFLIMIAEFSCDDFTRIRTRASRATRVGRIQQSHGRRSDSFYLLTA